MSAAIRPSTWRRCTGKRSSRWSLFRKRSLMGLAHRMRRRSWKPPAVARVLTYAVPILRKKHGVTRSNPDKPNAACI